MWRKSCNITLNDSKNESVLIGLRKQLDKIHNSSLNTAHSAGNLGFAFDEQLAFSDQVSALSKLAKSQITRLQQIQNSLV